MLISGEWVCHISRFGEEVTVVRLELTLHGDQISGFLKDVQVRGTFANHTLSMTATTLDGIEWGTLTAVLESDKLQGTINRGGATSQWTAWRSLVTPCEAKVHVFKPSSYPRLFSGGISPVLHVNPGDTIRTSLLDAGGWDYMRRERSRGGNPQTGPFFVNGSFPGDTLLIKIMRIRINRSAGVSGSQIMPNLLDPSYHQSRNRSGEVHREWLLDVESGIGKLASPTERLKAFHVHLRPSLGCVAVAPPAMQAFSSAWLGAWGGNLDYNRLREGVVISLPIFQEGALLFVGDGHALQCDGEINGDALEISTDVEFTVNVVKGSTLRGPRFEDDKDLMASGIAGSLQGALQQATTELARWLEHDYKLDQDESQIVLGCLIHYDIAVVVNQQMHVVARVSKAALSTIARTNATSALFPVGSPEESLP